MLDGNRSTTIGREPYIFAVGIGINLYKISVLCLNSSTRGLNLIAKMVAAPVLAVQDDIHRMTERSVAQANPSADLKGEDVPHEGLVSIVADEGPFLCRCRSTERTLLRVELESVRLLREVPAGISTTTDTCLASREKLGSVF